MALSKFNRLYRLGSRIFGRMGIKASEEQIADFLNWCSKDMWKEYTESRTQKRTVIENEIRALNIRLPNGTVGREYKFEFRLPAGKVKMFRLKGLEDLGLKWRTDGQCTCTVEGKPVKAGDFNVTLEYRPICWIPGEPDSELVLPLAFNADPRSLWKDKPTPTDIPFLKPDTDCAYIKVEAGKDGSPRKDIVAASKRGRSHAHEAKPRDDHFMVSHCEESDWYILAVADGAGSAKYSRRGSEIACQCVTDFCRQKLSDCGEFEAKIKAYYECTAQAVRAKDAPEPSEPESGTKDSGEAAAAGEAAARKEMGVQIYNIVGNAAFKAYSEICAESEKNAKELQCKLKDFSTTLMFAICKKFEFGWFVASFWVGDGAMCIYNENKQTAKLLGEPDEGEFSGQTRFLTMPEIFKDAASVFSRLRFSIEDDFTALMLMTDGVSDPMFETDRNLNDYSKWNEFWNKIKEGFPDDGIPGVDLRDDNPEAKDQLLRWMDFWSAGNHDDRTLAILY